MSSTIKIKAPQAIQPDGPWQWKNIRTGKSGIYENDPRKFGVDMEHPEYEWERLPSAGQLAARDAQWQEMVGLILKELKDAATSLETIGRLAGFAEYVGDDGERVPTYMKHGDEIRGYAKSRASAARAALSAITEE